MASETPPFWWREAGLWPVSLWPASWAYGHLARRRFSGAARDKVDLPILCVANLVVGGVGKTPVALALASAARRMGLKPGFTSAGPPRVGSKPHLVEPGRDSVRHAGVEALELAAHAPVAVSPDRAAAARMLAAQGCGLVVMIDGYAGARLAIDYALIVVDGHRGLGNGFVVPAGPIRAPLVDQLRNAGGAVLVGGGRGADQVVRLVSRAGKAVHQAKAVPGKVRSGSPSGIAKVEEAAPGKVRSSSSSAIATEDGARPSERASLAGRRFLAFAGIGAPERFFATVRQAGGEVVATRAFASGHHYTAEDVREIRAAAGKDRLEIVTTARDAVTLANAAEPLRSLLDELNVLDVEIVFEPADAAERIVRETVDAWRRRHFG